MKVLLSNRSFAIATIGAFAFAALAPAQGPPTLDPTYGFPVPKIVTAKAPPRSGAEWIWAAKTADKQTVFLRKQFAVSRSPAKAHLYVTADNYFTAYLDGHELGMTRPIEGDDFVWARVQRYEVTALMTPGRHVVALIVNNAGGPAGAVARLDLDGKPFLLSDKSWKTSEDAVAGWLEAGFDDSSWPMATEKGVVSADPWGGRLTGWPDALTSAPPYLKHLAIDPTSLAMLDDDPNPDVVRWSPGGRHLSLARPNLPTPRQWSVILDFGKELTGRIQIRSTLNGEVTIGTGESAGEAMNKPWTSTDLSLTAGKDGFTAYSAFRYAKLTFPATAERVNFVVRLDHLYYPVEYKGAFDCSDPLLTKIWYTGAYTAHLCMQDDIWDAPKRDRMRWMGDLHVSGEVINNVFLDRFLMEQTIRRLREDAQGGRPMTELPQHHVNGIPGYSCAWVCGLADLYRHTGNLDFVKDQREALISLLEFFRGELDANGVFANRRGEWPFVDWAPEFNKDTPQARIATHLFLIKASHEAAYLFAEMGDPANATKYANWSHDLESAARALLSQGGLFTDRRQANAMAVYSRMLAPPAVNAIYDAVLKPGTPAWDIYVSPYYLNYVLFAMSMAGHTQEAADYVRRHWGGMLAEGATSWWEGYDESWDKNDFHTHLGADDGTGYFVSLSHGWSAGPTNFLTERVLGVRSTGGGFATCEIAPDLGDLAWASGTVPTPHGALRVRMEKSGSGILLHLSVPRGVMTTVSLPGNAMLVNGRSFAPAQRKSGRVLARIGPGIWTVSSTGP